MQNHYVQQLVFLFPGKKIVNECLNSEPLLSDIPYEKLRTKIMNEQRKAQIKTRKQLNYK